MKEYRITDATGASAVILPEKGATVVSYQVGGREYLYRDDGNLASAERPRCGIPFLFPVFSRSPEDTFRWAGKGYPMQIHGFGHTSAWQVLSAEESRLCVALCADGATRRMYPFDFRVELTFTLQEGVLRVQQRYRNTGAEAMPYAFGFHPYWAVEDAGKTEVEIDAGFEMDLKSQKLIPCGRKTAAVAFAPGAREAGAFFSGAAGPAVIHVGRGRRVRMDFDTAFDRLVLWSVKDKGFLCVEPINSSPGGLATGDCHTLAPGESREAWVSFSVI